MIGQLRASESQIANKLKYFIDTQLYRITASFKRN